MSEEYYLLIDTSTEVCSVALGTADRVVSYEESPATGKHTETMAAMAARMLSRIDARQSLRGVGVASGPGSYTGLRIAASYAKGLCWTLDTPLAAVTTTELLVRTLLGRQADRDYSDALLMPMIDARRMEVYTALYRAQAEGTSGAIVTPETEVAAVVLTEEESRAHLREVVGDEPLYYFGSGAAKAQELFADLLPQSHFVEEITPRADALLGAVVERIHRGETEDIAYWEPYYLKEYEAKKSVNKVLSRLRDRS